MHHCRRERVLTMILPPYSFITGKAGTGKSTTIHRLAEQYKERVTKCATTGIAAINLGSNGDSATTLNALLGYFDTASLEEAYNLGRLHSRLRGFANKILIIDEVSMLGAAQFTLIMKAVKEVNDNGSNIQIVVVGDFCQLSPVNDGYAFEAPEWESFTPGIVKLEKVWRQKSVDFVNILNAARIGEGEHVAQGIPMSSYSSMIDYNFDGVTLVPTNNEVTEVNNYRYKNLLAGGAQTKQYPCYWWGNQRPEWKKNIPTTLDLCDKAYVMILANSGPDLEYANGDCGYLRLLSDSSVILDLVRTKKPVTVPYILRRILQRHTPHGLVIPETPRDKRERVIDSDTGEVLVPEESKLEYEEYLQSVTSKYRTWGDPYFDFVKKQWCVGEIRYLPIRLAYASTIHKAQGLTLTGKVQIVFTHRFISAPSMAYVALSRATELENITIVGTPHQVRERVNVLRKVMQWA